MTQGDKSINAQQCSRFGWHSDPAIDYCVEVNDLVCEYDAIGKGIGIITLPELQDRIFTASMFRVGGDQDAVTARGELLKLEDLLNKGKL